MAMETETVIERARLRFTGYAKGRYSDKVYVVELIRVGDSKYKVTCWNGAATAKNLTIQPKLKTPVSYSTAKAVFNETINKKCAPSYPTPYEVKENWKLSDENNSAPAAPTPATTLKPVKAKAQPAPSSDTDDQTTPTPPTSLNLHDPLNQLDALEI
jgi:hypothetical protein